MERENKGALVLSMDPILHKPNAFSSLHFTYLKLLFSLKRPIIITIIISTSFPFLQFICIHTYAKHSVLCVWISVV